MRRSYSERFRPLEDSPSKRTRFQEFQQQRRTMAEQQILELQAQLDEARQTLATQGLQIQALGNHRAPQQQQPEPAAPAQAYNPQNLNMNRLMAAANIQVCDPRMSQSARIKLFDATQFATNATEHDQANNPYIKHKLAEALGETCVSKAYSAYLDQAFKCSTLGLPMPAPPPSQAPGTSRGNNRRRQKPNQRKH